MRKPASAAVTLIAALLLLTAGVPAQIPDEGKTLADRLGEDDGFVFAVHCSGDVQGNLDPCGCTIPLGGLARRVGYGRALEAFTKGAAPLLQLDAGFLFDDTPPEGILYSPGIRNEWTLRAYAATGVAAANVSHRDLHFLKDAMRKRGYAERVKTFPFLDRLVSANVAPADPALEAFKPFVVHEVRGRRLGAGALRVGIIGFSEPTPAPGSPGTRGPVPAFTISDPTAAARKHLPALRAKCDVVVALAYMELPAARSIAAEVPGIDVVIAARQIPPFFYKDETVNATLLAHVLSQTKWLSEVRFYRDRAGRVANPLHRRVKMDGAVPDDSFIRAIVDRARAEFTIAR